MSAKQRKHQQPESIEGLPVYLAQPEKVPDCPHFEGREEELHRCRAAWGIDPKGKQFMDHCSTRLHFRLEGPPGVGKNELAYQIARELGLPFYMIQGHEDITPEDLALLLVPDANRSGTDDVPLILRASPLATAIYEGGLFFFDEINRVPGKSLGPLASALDSRQYIYSAMTGIRIGPKNDEARNRFRFCCALNPGVTEAGIGTLPDYIEQRTLPVFEIDYLPFDALYRIIVKHFKPSPQFLKAFRKWYNERAMREISVRQVLSFIAYAKSLGNRDGDLQSLRSAEPSIFRSGTSTDDHTEPSETGSKGTDSAFDNLDEVSDVLAGLTTSPTSKKPKAKMSPSSSKKTSPRKTLRRGKTR